MYHFQPKNSMMDPNLFNKLNVPQTKATHPKILPTEF